MRLWQSSLLIGSLLVVACAEAQVNDWGPTYGVGLSFPVEQLFLFGPANTCYAVQCSTDCAKWTTLAVLNPTVWPAQASLTVTQQTVFFRSAVLGTWSVGGFTEALDLRRDFGAVGDGIADDTAAVQAMFNSTLVHSNAVVFVPPGSYRLTQTCTLGNGTDGMAPHLVLLGLDPSKTIFQWAGAGTGPVFQFSDCSPEFGGITIQAPTSAGSGIIYTASQ
jgi:hypothetical protein